MSDKEETSTKIPSISFFLWLMRTSFCTLNCRCASLDEFLDPLRVHLVPRLSDNFVIGILGAVCKRLEGAIRKVICDVLL